MGGTVVTLTSRLTGLVLATCMAGAVLTAGSTLAQGPAADVSGTWHKNGDPNNPLKLVLRQFGSRVAGHFVNKSRKWMVRGSLSPNGTLTMTRWIPVSELAVTTDKGLAFARKKFGFANQPDFLRGSVTFKYDPDRLSLTGSYTRISITSGNNAPKGRVVTTALVMAKPQPSRLPVLVDRKTRFHRLFIVGPGYSAKEEKAFVEEVRKFAAQLNSTQYSRQGSTSKVITPADGKSVAAIKKQISALKLLAKPGDQVLLYIGSHGWGGAYSRDLNPKYHPIYRKMQLEHFRKYAKPDEKAAFDRAGKMAGKAKKELQKALLQKYKKDFRDQFFEAVNTGEIKKIKGEEFYEESVWIADNNPGRYETNDGEWLFDHEVASLLKPITDAGIPLTLFMDSCFGGGFADDLPASEKIEVIGLKIICPNPKYGSRFTLTGKTAKLISDTSVYMAENTVVSGQDVKRMLRKDYPKAVGPTADDRRDIDGSHERR